MAEQAAMNFLRELKMNLDGNRIDAFPPTGKRDTIHRNSVILTTL